MINLPAISGPLFSGFYMKALRANGYFLTVGHDIAF